MQGRTPRVRNLLAASALAALFAGPVLADEPAVEEVEEPKEFAMMALEGLGLKPALDDLNIKVYGWVEQSFTFNPDAPKDHINALRVFDIRSNEYMLNQVTLRVERPLADGNEFDVGGMLDLLYGSDGRFTHQRGIADNISGDEDDRVHGDKHNFDPLQMYGLVRVPVGNGLTVKFGKYVTTMGYEVIDARGNNLYSRSFLFGFAIPFGHTGVQFDYRVNDNWAFYYGLVQGWDVWADNNDTWSHMVGGSWTNGTDTVYFNFITGPEREDENTDYRSVLDLTWVHPCGENLLLALNFDIGNESGLTVEELDPDDEEATIESDTGKYWWGIAGYATYTISPQLAATLRGEYFRDATASRMGFTADVIEVTFGLNIKPCKRFMNLRLRPEVRVDHAFGDSPFDQGENSTQVTIGMDAILTY